MTRPRKALILRHIGLALFLLLFTLGTGLMTRPADAVPLTSSVLIDMATPLALVTFGTLVIAIQLFFAQYLLSRWGLKADRDEQLGA